jgi:hypothetical protein
MNLVISDYDTVLLVFFRYSQLSKDYNKLICGKIESILSFRI